MATMYGADVAQLRQLAAQFDAKAQALDANRMTVGNAIQISAWVGPVAVRFRHTWESDYTRRLHDAAMGLRDAATKLRANADDQERTSAVDSGAGRDGAPGGGNGWSGRELSGGEGAHLDPRALVDGIGSMVGIVGQLDTLSDLYGRGSFAPKILGPIGVMFDTAAMADAVNSRDGVGVFLNGVSAATGAAGVVSSAYGPLGLSIGVAKTFVDWTLPYNSQSVDETYAKGAELMFGPDTDPNHLSSEQAQAMTKRYDGILGVAHMISDRMDATADVIFPWNWGKKR